MPTYRQLQTHVIGPDRPQVLYEGEFPANGKITAARVYTTTVAPTVNNDGVDTAGLGMVFYPSDLWNDTSGGIYECQDNASGAAVWTTLSNSGTVDTTGTIVADDIAVFTDSDTVQGLSGSEFVSVYALINGADAVSKEAFTANSILIATAAAVPTALTIPEDSIVGRVTAGVIDALTATEVRTLINVEDGADVTDSTNVDAAGATMNTDWNTAHAIMYTSIASSPAPLYIPEEYFITRPSGGVISAVSAVTVRSLLDILKITVATAAPTGPATNDLWIDTG